MRNYKEELTKLKESILIDLADILIKSPTIDGLVKYKTIALKGNIKYLGGKIVRLSVATNIPDTKYTDGGFRLVVSNGSTNKLIDTDIYTLVAITEELQQLAEEASKQHSIYSNI